MNPTLLILAAGRSQRYGSPKQLAGVGPQGETLLEYSIYDAIQAGFGRVAVVTRPEHRPLFTASLARVPLPITFMDQSDAQLPEGRTKPWGTAHAILSVEPAVNEPFAAVNADDFYGRTCYQHLSEFLRRHSGVIGPTFALAGYTLRETLSHAGGVSRAICSQRGEWLLTITEVSEIRSTEDGLVGVGENGDVVRLSGDEATSMNAWGFTPAIFPLLQQRFAQFLAAHGQDLEREFRLSTEVNALVAAGGAQVEILPTFERWTGMTHAADQPRVAAHLAQLVAAGRYPTPLFGAE
jgi:choline kinase